jgi:hypothetical protein
MSTTISFTQPVDVHPIPVAFIERRIYLIRGQKVMIDSDLACLYQIETFNLNKAVKRNPNRFPADFMFQLTAEEWEALTFQIGISNGARRGGRRYMPYVFTEQGIAMLSSVLSSERAVEVNIAIMRAFVHLRQFLATHRDLADKMAEIDRTQLEQGAHIEAIWQAIQNLIEAPMGQKRRIGFQTEAEAQ